MRKLGKVAVVPAIASSLIAVGATAAHASSRQYHPHFYSKPLPGHYVTNAAMRSKPGTLASKIGTAHQGDHAMCIAFTRSGGFVSESVNGVHHANATWSVCSNLSRLTNQGGRQGWTWSPLLAPGF